MINFIIGANIIKILRGLLSPELEPILVLILASALLFTFIVLALLAAFIEHRK